MMKTNRLLLAGGILAGAAAGMAIGALLASDKGSATRRKIAEKGEDYLDKMNELLEDVTNKLKTVREAVAGHTCTCDNSGSLDKEIQKNKQPG